METIVLSPELTPADVLVLKNLAGDIQDRQSDLKRPADGTGTDSATPKEKLQSGSLSHGAPEPAETRNARDLAHLVGLNDPASQDFEPSVFSSWDLSELSTRLHPAVHRHILQPYISWARTVARHDTDVIMVTHLIMYFTTSIPSAIWLFYRFSYLHGILHVIMQGYYIGAHTLMRHQHIHQRGVLAKRSWMQVFDQAFPYILDPLMGHTWNSYYYHHVKHHHVEGNGPDDLSSTIRYQRDNVWHFLHYVGRFYFLIWLDLPLYFIRKGRLTTGLKAATWELSNYVALIVLLRLNFRATFFTLLLPLLCMRVGLMVGNWGQHAFVDADEPDSDYRSSITLIDVPSNRYCYNDGYHTSHHLNPLRHWRDHPVHFIQNKEIYSQEHALVFHNIDYIMITVKLFQHDYDHLAKCLVPIGDQIDMTLEERAAMLKRHTRQFSEEEIREKFGTAKAI
ncbi:Uu.00g109430.m01.CDS01 [Anthostomella pinea]|uniref:Uu.00g109430.m01.CDS01 n=1 Tax=Anthostomella pinea TaxID=933095 RepID=A0AAI8VFN6_9PEZI|nr:Uu.00g109430.m01.CDS01 [Anthostomella pinea]